jgi:hypothetical protein
MSVLVWIFIYISTILNYLFIYQWRLSKDNMVEFNDPVKYITLKQFKALSVLEHCNG